VAGTAKEAPHGLELVRAFVNTKDFDHDTDELTSPGELADWLVAAGLAGDGQRASASEAGDLAAEPASEDLAAGAADLRRAIDLREALRAALLVNNEGGAPESAAIAVLNRVAARAKLVTRFDKQGGATLDPVSGGVDGALGRLLAIVYGAMESGDWRRLKVCRSDTCLWAFYDTTKNRSRHWCSMDDCGSQVKARTYRQRKKVAPTADTA
jgi:predicted RNA-binding Zn ribbon-like protein